MPVPSLSNYPAALDDDTTLFKLQDRKSFTLSADITDTSLTMIVNESCAGLTGNFFLAFATGELVYVTAVTVGSRAMTIIRGASGTSPAPHMAGEVMKMTVSATFFEMLKKAVIAVQAELGLNPSGSFSDVGNRFADAEARIGAHNHTGGANGPVIDAGTVDGIHAAVSATANMLLALNSSSRLPADITGDADTIDGSHSSDFQRAGAFVVAHGQVRTLSLDAITIVPGLYFYTVDTEAAAAADDLKSISGGAAGDVIILRSVSPSRVVSIKTGGNIDVAFTIAMDAVTEIALHYDGTYWRLVGAAPASTTSIPATAINLVASGQTATPSGAAVFFDGELYDDLGWHNSSAPARITPGVAGWYQGWGTCSVQNPSADQHVTMSALMNDATVIGEGRAFEKGGYTHIINFFIPRTYFGATDYLIARIATSSVNLPIYSAVLHLEKMK